MNTNKIKKQLVDININQFPLYSYNLNRDLKFLIRYIRVHLPKNVDCINDILIELSIIKSLLETRMRDFPDYDSLENMYELVICTIITLKKFKSLL